MPSLRLRKQTQNKKLAHQVLVCGCLCCLLLSLHCCYCCSCCLDTSLESVVDCVVVHLVHYLDGHHSRYSLKLLGPRVGHDRYRGRLRAGYSPSHHGRVDDNEASLKA